MKLKKSIEGTILVTMLLLSTFLLVLPTASAEPAYGDISVQQVHHMLMHHSGNLVILDVRNQSEYKLGHLYNAVSMPLYELQRFRDLAGSLPVNGTQPLFANIFKSHVNDIVIVYCTAGTRSATAYQILAQNNLTKIYNMQGGITAWMQANYPIYCNVHYASVDLVNEQSVIDIEPWLLHIANCTPCQSQSCSGTSNSNLLPNATTTIVEENENQTIIVGTSIINGTTYEFTYTKTLLWDFNKVKYGSNRTISLYSTEIDVENVYADMLVLQYNVQNEDYNLTVTTTLSPSDSQYYNRSSTFVQYAPAGKLLVPAKEIFQFNSSATLSQQFSILGELAKKMGNIYQRSDENALIQLSGYYDAMKKDLNYLSRTVENKIPQYDLMIEGATQGRLSVGSLDPEAVLNGGFESGDSYWVLSGAGDHYVSNWAPYAGSYSLQLGYSTQALYNTRDDAYQLINIPAGSTNKQLSFAYHWWSYSSFMYFEVYVAPVGGNPTLVFEYDGEGLNDWAGTNIDLSSFSGDLYVYFSVLSYDGYWPACCWVDEVSVTYETPSTCNSDCIVSFFANCYSGGQLLDTQLYCMAGCLIGALMCGPFYPACAAGCWGIICGIAGGVELGVCALLALVYCCI
jgi:rhodanese-related sulfurtransferase